MKILQDISHEAEYIGDIQENRVGIDRENIDFITTLLTSNLYSKPLESFLRETIANAYDSHIEAGTDEYILLVITKKSYKEYTISVRDYGVGVSPERFNQIYRNIGSSTKRESNDYIGAFGIGRFAGLSCADVVNINSYYNKVKYSYVMYKNGKGINIDKLSEQHDDSFKNGLEVIISISTGSESELERAIDKLTLFKKLHIEYIDKSGYNYDGIKYTVANFNSRIISDFKTFSLCNIISNDRYFRVGNIIYKNSENEWYDLDTRNGIIINIPIGEVDITPNREELQFTDKTKQAIKYYIQAVKKELQEIVNKIQNNDFTLKRFYQYSISRWIEFETPALTLKISKEDVKLSIADCKINNKPVPIRFNDFLKEITSISIHKEDLYKVFNSGKYYGFRRLNKGNIRWDCIFDEEVYLGVKLDKTCKAITLAWYEDEYIGDKCIAVIYNLETQKDCIRHYLSDWKNDVVENCINYLVDILKFYNISNDDVSEEYKNRYKLAHKKQNTVNNSSEISIRHYSNGVYSRRYLRELPINGSIIYSANTRDDSTISELSKLLHHICNVSIITAKKEYLPLFESNKRFILLEDFLDFPNNILKKIVTARIISRNLNPLSAALGYAFFNIPIIKEFNKKYNQYIRANTTFIAQKEGYIKELLDSYEAKGWYNKADVRYFKVDDAEIDVLKTIQDMNEHKSEIIKCIAFFMFGRNNRLGVNMPHVNICKYLKKFKYECI